MSVENTNSKSRFQVWKIILLPIILALIPFVYPQVQKLLTKSQPQFILESPVVKHGQQAIYIFAENKAAEKKENLNVEISGLELKGAARLVQENPLKWKFRFLDHELPRAILGEGINTISLRFPGEKRSNEMNFYINLDFFDEDVAILDYLDTQTKGGGDDEGSDIPPQRTTDTEIVVRVGSLRSDDDPLVEEMANLLKGNTNIKNVIQHQDRIEHQQRGMQQTEIRTFNKAQKALAEQMQQNAKEKFGIEAAIKDYSERLARDAKSGEVAEPQMEILIR